MKELSLIIVNWNSAEYLKKCLQSIYLQTKQPDFEIIVVDNASYDGSDELIRNEFPEVKFIQSAENIGFARANNLGFQHASGRNLLFLNPDTEIIGAAIEVIFTLLEAIPDAGAVGCKLLNADLTVQTNSIMPFPTILNQALDVEYLKLSLPWLNLWGIKPLFNNDTAYEEVEVISGACIMVKRKVFEDIKMFSPDYFMYSEELDLCYKIKKAGFKAYYTGEAAIIHHGGRSVNKTQIKYFPILMMQESLLKFLKKTRGTLYGTVYRLMTAVVAVSRLILITGFMPVGFFVFDRPALYYSYNKWKKILRWAICLDDVQMPKHDYVKNPIGKC